MAFIMKITWSPDGPFRSFILEGPPVGALTTWGIVDRDGPGFRSAGDVKFFRESGLAVGEEGILVERHSSRRLVAAHLQIVDLGAKGDDVWEPTYRVLGRDFPNNDLSKLRKTDARIGSLPHFQKNSPGTMLRSFLPLDNDDLHHFKAAVSTR